MRITAKQKNEAHQKNTKEKLLLCKVKCIIINRNMYVILYNVFRLKLINFRNKNEKKN